MELITTVQQNWNIPESSKINKNKNNSVERINVKTKTICRQTEVTTVKKAQNIVTTKTLVLSSYVTKTSLLVEN